MWEVMISVIVFGIILVKDQTASWNSHGRRARRFQLKAFRRTIMRKQELFCYR